LKRHNNDGELKELPSHKKTAAAKQFPDKALTYGMLKHTARERGDGWASHKFHTIPISTSRIVASPIGYPLGKLLVVAGPPVYDPLAGSRQLSRARRSRTEPCKIGSRPIIPVQGSPAQSLLLIGAGLHLPKHIVKALGAHKCIYRR
jgi:hypothetical protein